MARSNSIKMGELVRQMYIEQLYKLGVRAVSGRHVTELRDSELKRVLALQRAVRQ